MEHFVLTEVVRPALDRGKAHRSAKREVFGGMRSLEEQAA
jgi:hypothetical protein